MPKVNLVDNNSFIIIVTLANYISLSITERYIYTAAISIVPRSNPNRSILACNLGTNGYASSTIML